MRASKTLRAWIHILGDHFPGVLIHIWLDLICHLVVLSDGRLPVICKKSDRSERIRNIAKTREPPHISRHADCKRDFT